MKILEFEYRGPPALGGVEILVVEISRWFKSKGHEVEIWSSDLLNFTGQKDSQLKRTTEGIEVKKFRSLRFPRIFLLIFSAMYPAIYPKMLFTLLKLRGGPDIVVHSHSFPSFHSYLALLFHKKFGKVAITLHGDINDLKGIYSTLGGKLAFKVLRYFVNRKDNVYLTADTKGEMEFYTSNLKFKENKVFVVPTGVNLEEFDAIKTEEVYEIKSQYNLEKTFNVLYAGRLAKLKGVEVLIKATSKLRNTNTRLIINGPDFGALTDMKKLSQELGLGNRVIFIDALERRKFCTVIKSCDVLVLPSFRGAGIVLAEAMACSKPVIASKTPGTLEIVADGRNGFLFDIGSVEQLSEKIKLLYTDRNLCKKLGAQGRAIVQQNYTWENVANTYLELWVLKDERYGKDMKVLLNT